MQVNADVASLHANLVVETVDNVRRQKELSNEPFDSSHQRGISDDMERMFMWKLEKSSIPGEEISPKRSSL
jgi:hypothetical protein